MISYEDKEKFRKIAFRNKKTMSELNRELIQFVILMDDMNSLDFKNNETENELNKILNKLGLIT